MTSFYHRNLSRVQSLDAIGVAFGRCQVRSLRSTMSRKPQKRSLLSPNWPGSSKRPFPLQPLVPDPAGSLPSNDKTLSRSRRRFQNTNNRSRQPGFFRSRSRTAASDQVERRRMSVIRRTALGWTPASRSSYLEDDQESAQGDLVKVARNYQGQAIGPPQFEAGTGAGRPWRLRNVQLREAGLRHCRYLAPAPLQLTSLKPSRMPLPPPKRRQMDPLATTRTAGPPQPLSASFANRACHSLALRRFVLVLFSAMSHLLAEQTGGSGPPAVGAVQRTLTPATPRAPGPRQSQHPQGHLVLDNLNTHKDTTRGTFLTDWNRAHRNRFIVHYTPTHGSWLNQVELWFSLHSRRILRYGNFSSRQHLVEAVERFIQHWNLADAKPFRWTYEGRPLVST